ncbi:MAG: cytochrome P460 family protein [Candidatus Tectomicrobia bacterium]|nr:cytochrome P460 family protein [Candidatus Tectomicrobia bacterium]
MVHGAAAQSSAAKFDNDGNLIRPEGYREWIHVGTPLTPNDMNSGKAPFPEFHHVYIDRDSWQHYKKTGKFRDGTMLVKELISVGSKAASSGAGYFMGEFIGLEATVKDAKRFPKEPGNWAYFSFTPEGSPMMDKKWVSKGGAMKDNSPAFPTGVCAACHVATAAEDMVFTQYYPVLRAAKPKK